MTVQNICNELIEVWRYSYLLYSGSAVNAVTIGIDPSAESIIRVTLATAQTGTIYLNGSTTETLTFTASKLERSANLYTTLAGVSPVGLTGNMDVETFDERNESVRSLIFNDNIYGYFKMDTNQMLPEQVGMMTKCRAMLFASGDADIQDKDVIIRNEDSVSVRYEANNVITYSSGGNIGHKEMELTKIMQY